MTQSAGLFCVSEPLELLALWRLVAEAKFHPDPEDRDLWGSPYVNALSTRLANAMLVSCEARGDLDQVARHRKWVSSLPDNVVLPVVKAHLKNDAKTDWWRDQTQEQKFAYVRGCVSPFEPDRDYLAQLIHEAEV